MRENTNGPPTLTGGILEVSELLTRAMRTDDSELLFSDSFNDYGSMKPILFLLSFSSPLDRRVKENFNVLENWDCNA